jgi:arylformamidase
MASFSLQIEVGGRRYAVVQPGISIAIPLNFNGAQPNTYGVAQAQAQAYESGGWVGDTRRGGSCNFETYTFTPHCNGTHTECVGHIVDERLRIHEQLQESLIPAMLITVEPVKPDVSDDGYDPALNDGDLVIDREMLEDSLRGADLAFCEALVIRTTPNAAEKMARDYMQHPPAFFTLEAMAYLVELGVVHLLVDMPSVDRLFDEGKLSAHHIFWGLEAGSHTIGLKAIPKQTITEMIYVPDFLADGTYLLNLQIAPFMADAAPSRPVLYALNPA